jgi:hypothetical protein
MSISERVPKKHLPSQLAQARYTPLNRAPK